MRGGVEGGRSDGDRREAVSRGIVGRLICSLQNPADPGKLDGRVAIDCRVIVRLGLWSCFYKKCKAAFDDEAVQHHDAQPSDLGGRISPSRGVALRRLAPVRPAAHQQHRPRGHLRLVRDDGEHPGLPLPQLVHAPPRQVRCSRFSLQPPFSLGCRISGLLRRLRADLHRGAAGVRDDLPRRHREQRSLLHGAKSGDVLVCLAYLPGCCPPYREERNTGLPG
mmetsp:Transcript_68048/g.172195  ORF Transcript_68048/g.172195 Transcript_68048/m.172195 type:complete len:222 (+) Transcript_68048:2-667(+)